MKELISRNLLDLHGRIAEACEEHDRDTDDIEIVAVTKTHPVAVIRTAVASGLVSIGESRVQEAESKIAEVGPIATFHLVGHLQTNKVKKAVALFDVIQSVDSLKLAREISSQAGMIERTIECYLEVNCSGESSKFGFEPVDCLEAMSQMAELPNLKLTGLMTIGPLTDDEDAVSAAFGSVYDLFKKGQEIVGEQFDTLSMGMSGDFTLAIAEGSTMIRIGSALFGSRQQ